MEYAIDLSVRQYHEDRMKDRGEGNRKKIVKPTPIPPWSILWYQSIWGNSSFVPFQRNCLNTSETLSSSSSTPIVTEFRKTSDPKFQFNVAPYERFLEPKDENPPSDGRGHQCRDELGNLINSRTNELFNNMHSTLSPSFVTTETSVTEALETTSRNRNFQENAACPEVTNKKINGTFQNQYAPILRPPHATFNPNSIPMTPSQVVNGNSNILDIASCDGPVQFERISNPNFALTVQHKHADLSRTSLPTSTSFNTRSQPSASPSFSTCQPHQKTYICIYCNQCFKSLFCYQKHKKRHLNPVSVDLTASGSDISVQNRTQIKDINVQFFPCKKCGSKFPSYYFVHKHKKICHSAYPSSTSDKSSDNNNNSCNDNSTRILSEDTDDSSNNNNNGTVNHGSYTCSHDSTTSNNDQLSKKALDFSTFGITNTNLL